MDLTRLVGNAKKSVFFTSPNLERDLSKFLDEWADEVRALAKKIVSDKIQRIYWVGSGNSWCNLYSGHYILNRFSTIPSEYYQAYEFMWQDPRGLDSDALVILASFSGKRQIAPTWATAALRVIIPIAETGGIYRCRHMPSWSGYGRIGLKNSRQVG